MIMLSPEIREIFYKNNGITHAFSWKDGNMWVLYLGDNNLNGFKEGEFKTLSALRESLSSLYPELPFYKGN